MCKEFVVGVLLVVMAVGCGKKENGSASLSPVGQAQFFVAGWVRNEGPCKTFENGRRLVKVEPTSLSGVSKYTKSYASSKAVDFEAVRGLVLTFDSGNPYFLPVESNDRFVSSRDLFESARNLILLASNTRKINISCESATNYTSSPGVGFLYLAQPYTSSAYEGKRSDLDGIVKIENFELR